MIDATECRELAAECRQMADRAQTIRVRSILIDIARTWDRLALEVEHGTARITPKQVLRHPAAQRIDPDTERFQTVNTRVNFFGTGAFRSFT